MSGGSFDYLYMADPQDMLVRSGDVKAQAEWARSHMRYDLAEELEKYALDLEMFRRMVETRHKRLEKLMFAIEWVASMDWSIDQLDKEWQKFLEGQK